MFVEIAEGVHVNLQAVVRVETTGGLRHTMYLLDGMTRVLSMTEYATLKDAMMRYAASYEVLPMGEDDEHEAKSERNAA